MIPIIWILLIAVEAYRHYYIIEKMKLSPDHAWSFVTRAIVAIVLWFISPWIDQQMRVDQWWALPIMFAFTFWWAFDTLLAIFRGRDYWDIGDPADPEEDSWIDGFQLKHGGAWVWFWFKFLLCGASITLVVYGFRAVMMFQ